MDKEQIILVDEYNQPVGVADKLSSHHGRTLLHRAFSCYIFNDKNQLLVTKRASSKKVWPGVWTNSVCGHPMPGESTEDAIMRRARFELGLEIENIEMIVADYRYTTPPFNGIIENEYCPIYLARTKLSPKPNQEEVGDHRWMDWKVYREELASDTDDVYSWWSKDQLEHIELYVEGKVGEYKSDIISVKKEIDRRLKIFLRQKYSEAFAISPSYGNLWRFIDESITAGGKRIRPYILMLAYRAYSRDKSIDYGLAYKAGLAIELLHNAMLIHDDIIDKDLIRHGVDNVGGRYIKLYSDEIRDDKKTNHYANSAAIIAGDLLISSSRTLVSSGLDLDRDQISKVSLLMDEAIFRVCGGELLDTEAAFREDKADSTKIAIEKTSSYSFEVPLAIGATLAGADSSEIDLLARKFGGSLGLAFQIKDDILGIFGDEKVLGKSTTSDIREGKRTYMVERFYDMATQQQIDNFEFAFAKEDASESAEKLAKKMLVESGALEAAEVKLSSLIMSMEKTVKKLGVNGESKNKLIELMNMCVKREY